MIFLKENLKKKDYLGIGVTLVLSLLILNHTIVYPTLWVTPWVGICLAMCFLTLNFKNCLINALKGILVGIIPLCVFPLLLNVSIPLVIMAPPSMMLVVGIVALSLSCLSKIEGCFRDERAVNRGADTDLEAQREAQRLCTDAVSGKPVSSAALEPNTLSRMDQGLNEPFCQIKNELVGQLSIG